MTIDYDELARLAPDAVREFSHALWDLAEALVEDAEDGKPHPVDAVIDEMNKAVDALVKA